MSSPDQSQQVQPQSDDDNELSDGEVDQSGARGPAFLSSSALGQTLEALLRREPLSDSEENWRQLLTWCQMMRLENQNLWREMGRLRTLLQTRDERTPSLSFPMPSEDLLTAREFVPLSLPQRLPVRTILQLMPRCRGSTMRRRVHGVPCHSNHLAARKTRSEPSLVSSLPATASRYTGTSTPLPTSLPTTQALSCSEVDAHVNRTSAPVMLTFEVVPSPDLRGDQRNSVVQEPQLCDSELPRDTFAPADLSLNQDASEVCTQVESKQCPRVTEPKVKLQENQEGGGNSTLARTEGMGERMVDGSEQNVNGDAVRPKQVLPRPTKMKAMMSWDSSNSDPKSALQDSLRNLREEMAKACRQDPGKPEHNFYIVGQSTKIACVLESSTDGKFDNCKLPNNLPEITTPSLLRATQADLCSEVTVKPRIDTPLTWMDSQLEPVNFNTEAQKRQGKESIVSKLSVLEGVFYPFCGMGSGKTLSEPRLVGEVPDPALRQSENNSPRATSAPPAMTSTQIATIPVVSFQINAGMKSPQSSEMAEPQVKLHKLLDGGDTLAKTQCQDQRTDSVLASSESKMEEFDICLQPQTEMASVEENTQGMKKDAFCPPRCLRISKTFSEPHRAEVLPAPVQQLHKTEQPRTPSAPAAAASPDDASCHEVSLHLENGFESNLAKAEDNKQRNMDGSEKLRVNIDVVWPKQILPHLTKMRSVQSCDSSTADVKLNTREKLSKLRQEMLRSCENDLVDPDNNSAAPSTTSEPVCNLKPDGTIKEFNICLDCCPVPHKVEVVDGVPVGHLCHGPPIILVCPNTLKAVELKCPHCVDKGPMEVMQICISEESNTEKMTLRKQKACLAKRKRERVDLVGPASAEKDTVSEDTAQITNAEHLRRMRMAILDNLEMLNVHEKEEVIRLEKEWEKLEKRKEYFREEQKNMTPEHRDYIRDYLRIQEKELCFNQRSKEVQKKRERDKLEFDLEDCCQKLKVEEKAEGKMMKILQRQQRDKGKQEKWRIAHEEKQLKASEKKLEKQRAMEEKKTLETKRREAKEEKKRLEKELAEKENREKEENAVRKKREKEELAAKKKREKDELAERKNREKEELAQKKNREKEELAERKKREKEELAVKKKRDKELKKMDQDMKKHFLEEEKQRKKEEKEELAVKKRREKELKMMDQDIKKHFLEEEKQRKKVEKEELAVKKKREKELKKMDQDMKKYFLEKENQRKKEEKEELAVKKKRKKELKKMDQDMKKHFLEEEKQRKKEEKKRMAKEKADAKGKLKAEKKRMKEEIEERKKTEREEMAEKKRRAKEERGGA